MQKSHDISHLRFMIWICLIGFGGVVAKTIKIMPLGDSITEIGCSYRDDLFTGLKSKGFDIDMVGSNTSQGCSDNNHEGHGGFTIGPGANKADEWSGGKGNVSINIDQWLKVNPDVILVYLGVNDFFNLVPPPPSNEVETLAVTKLDGLFAKIYSSHPDVMIFFGTLMGLRSSPDYYDKFNANLLPLEKKWLNTGKAIRLVDLRKQVNMVAGDYSDDIHPGSSGYTKMAAAWLGPVSQYLPASTRLGPVYPGPKKWNPDARPWTKWSERWLFRVDGQRQTSRFNAINFGAF